jgi:hypothetical protein
MNMILALSNPVAGSSNRSFSGFTLTNLMVSLTIFGLVLGSMMAAHLFGLRMMELSRRQLEASDTFTRSFSPLFTDIRSAKQLRLGDGDRQSFREVPMTAVQQGNALQIYPTRDTNLFVRYYLDSQDHVLKRLDPLGSLTVIVQSITNNVLFKAEDYAGATLTNLNSFAAITITLDVTKGNPPATPAGITHLETRITSRLFE